MSHKKVENFKMIVTPGQSAIVQDFLFKGGYCWESGDNDIDFCNFPYLFFDEGFLSCCKREEFFKSDTLPKLSFKTFENKYLL